MVTKSLAKSGTERTYETQAWVGRLPGRAAEEGCLVEKRPNDLLVYSLGQGFSWEPCAAVGPVQHGRDGRMLQTHSS